MARSFAAVRVGGAFPLAAVFFCDCLHLLRSIRFPTRCVHVRNLPEHFGSLAVDGASQTQLRCTQCAAQARLQQRQPLDGGSLKWLSQRCLCCATQNGPAPGACAASLLYRPLQLPPPCLALHEVEGEVVQAFTATLPNYYDAIPTAYNDVVV